VSRASPDVQVNASVMGSRFGDTELAALEPLRDHITSFDASRTSITDASAARLAAMPKLTMLRLTDTAVTGRTASVLAGSRSLASLATVGTNIQPGDLALLRKKGVRIYASAD
jgi:hypothetical protein